MTSTMLRVLTAALLVGATAAACRTTPRTDSATSKPQPEAPEEHEAMPERVKLTSAATAEAGIATWQVKPVDLEHLLVLNGTVGHDENKLIQIAANVRGRVTSIPVDLGARVRTDDALVLVESVEMGKAREEFLRELSTFRVASRAYERSRALVDGKAISSGEFQAREGEYLSRKAAAESAERALHLIGASDDEISGLRKAVESDAALPSGDAPRLTLRAPFDGRVIDRKVTPGSLVEALQPLMTVADLRTVWVFLQAYEKDLALLCEGLVVTIWTEAYPQETFRGRIDFMGSVLDASTRTVKLRATVENGSEKLRPGMFIKAHVDVPKPEEEARAILAVPQSALQTLEGRTTVFVRVEPGVFERRFVEIGHSFEGFTEILSGIKTREVVVTEGSFVLKSEFAKATLAEEH